MATTVVNSHHLQQQHGGEEDNQARTIVFRNTSRGPFRLRWRDSPNPIGTILPGDSLGQNSFVGHVFELTQTSSSSSPGLKRFLVMVGEKKQEQTATLTSSLSLSCEGCTCVWEGELKEEERGEGG
eukprot:CAMPEP_0201506842 /NCGR_PEP_ID=MMETSP0161_2-20130828/687_1 /ASSEMBLY_ACC=CAM_ASM_000251 /TAXON_ID=180227 /ORGANISM="Neoparamoeba aestuarina, Strain SoJaBio B1-5/56/2" /LENGTH=125 /DNA_ID=CAMNT_0047901057 /DNA_START=57 /DNA_END=430 /DNA_ORIENTATION=-